MLRLLKWCSRRVATSLYAALEVLGLPRIPKARR
jgi:hypothetical protein